MKKADAIALVNLRGGEVISFGALIAPKNVTIDHKVKVGGGSWTDGRRMETGLFDFFINDEEEDDKITYKMSHGLFSLKGLTAHEYGHVWFTKFNEMKNLTEKIQLEMEAEGINPMLARKVTSHIFNCTEDGRIEKRMTNMYHGLKNYFQYNNGTVWKLDPEVMPVDKELDNLLRCICTYSVVGLKPRWYKTTKGTKLRDEFEKTIPYIDKAIDAPTCHKNTEITYELIHEIWDYLIELLKQTQEDQEKMQELMDQLGDGDIQEGQNGEGDGTSAGNGSESSRLSDGSEGDEAEGDGEGSGESSSNDIGDNSGAAGSTKGLQQKVESYKETTEMSKDGPGYDYSKITGTGGGSTKVIKSKAGHKTITPEELIEEAVSESEGLAEKEAAKKPNPPKTKEPKSSTMSRAEVERMVSDVGYDHEDIKTYREERNKYKMIPLSDELRAPSTKFRRKVERCFKEKNMLITKMSSGKLDTRQLYRLGMKEYNVFMKQANRSLADAVVEVCWDGSGSMCGGKQKFSADACAIIEEGLKGVVPLKIINFTTDWSHREVVHYLVKDFDENDRHVNYTLSYSHSKNFNGGNKDGYDIRVCTEDLMKRKEKDKILIVLSDGLPSDYETINPQEDVKDAVKCARRKGLIVIPIFFGDEYFREEALSDYEYMYEKNIINSAPEELPARLAKLFEALVLK